MRRMFFVMLSLLLLVPTYGAFADSSQSHGDLVVVDRTTRDKTLNDYTHLTKSTIQKAWRTPIEMAVPGALKGKVAINYCIDRNGKLESAEVVRGSGNPGMDQSLLEAIRAAAPFPSFPDQLQAGRVLIRANFVVADLPTAPVTTVQHILQNRTNEQVQQEKSGAEKSSWDVTAGSPGTPDTGSENAITPAPAPPTKKYKWGLP